MPGGLLLFSLKFTNVGDNPNMDTDVVNEPNLIKDAELLIEELRLMQNGANVHTINKAVSYLISLQKPVWYIKEDAERRKRFEGHVANCRAAVNRSDVEALRMQMIRWF